MDPLRDSRKGLAAFSGAGSRSFMTTLSGAAESGRAGCAEGVRSVAVRGERGGVLGWRLAARAHSIAAHTM